MSSRVAVLAGDGIGPEVTRAAVRVLHAAIPAATFTDGAIGAAYGRMPDEQLRARIAAAVT